MRWIDRLLAKVRMSPRRAGRRQALRFEPLEARDVPAVTGVVFRDTGGDGLRGATDTGIAGVTVELLQADEVVGQTKTGPAGAFTFNTLEAATDYQLRIGTTQAPLADLVPTQPDLGDDDAADSDFAAVDDEAATVEFATETGDEALTFDAGFAPANPELTLGGQVFADADDSGTLDEGETGVAGVTVELVGEASDAALATATTGADGTYTFTGLEAGTYRVRLAAANFTGTGPLVGRAPSEMSNPTADDDIDGDSNGEASGTLGGGGVVLSGPITLAGGEEPAEDGDTSPNTNLTVDFGMAATTTPPPTPTGTSIAGRVFLDYDNSGAANDPDAGVAGVTITLTGGDLTEPLTTQTETDGSFAFSDLAAGTYTLTETQPTTPASRTGTDTAGTAGGTADEANAIAGIELAEGDAATGYNFAEVPLVSTGGTVFADADGDGTFDTGETGVPGVTITLTGTSVVDGEIAPVTATTDPQGAYTFDGLTPGTYTIAETQPAGFTDAAEQNGTPAATVTDDTFADIDLTTTAAASGGFNFGERSDTTPPPPPPTAGGSLAGAVFEDANGNGTRQAAEAGIAGVTVRLTGTTDDGAVDRTTTTGTDGSFEFTGLAAGTYTLTETQPTGRPDGAETAGTAGGTTTTNDAIGGITLAADQAGTGYLFADRAAATPGDEEGAADVRTALFVNTPRVPPGGFVVLTAVVRNRGDADAAGPEATVNLGGLRFMSASSDDYDPESETWAVGELGAGESAVLRITAQAPARGAFTPAVAVTDGEGLTEDPPRVAAATVLSTWMPMRWFLLSSWFGGFFPTPPVVPVAPPAPAPAAPATPTLTLAAASDTGTAGDRSTDLATVTLTGTTTAGADVTLVETGAVATADDAGAFQFADVPLTVGENEFTVRATTDGGTRTGTATITRVEATTLEPPAEPTLGLAAASDTGTAGDGSTDLATVTLVGTTTAGADVELVETGATATADLTGAFEFADVPVALGANTFTVRATTPGGTSSGTTTITRVAAASEDDTPPVAPEPEDPPATDGPPATGEDKVSDDDSVTATVA